MSVFRDFFAVKQKPIFTGSRFGFGSGGGGPSGPPPFEGSGGTMIPTADSGNGYTYHVYTTSGAFTAPAPHPIEVFLVAAGGRGGEANPGHSGGGGGGGVQYYTDYQINAGPATVEVGSGDSTFTSTGQPVVARAKTGGNGGSVNNGGSPGGSGGGGGGGGSGPGPHPGGTATQPTQPLIAGFGGTNYGNNGLTSNGGWGGGAASPPSRNGGAFPAFAAPIVGPALASPTIPHVGPTGLYAGGGGSGGGPSNSSGPGGGGGPAPHGGAAPGGFSYGGGGSGSWNSNSRGNGYQGICIIRYQP